MLALLTIRDDNLCMSEDIRKFDSNINPDAISQVSFLDLLGDSDLPDWNMIVQRIADLHYRYYRLTDFGIVTKVPNINTYFMEAANWMLGKAQTSNFVAIPANGSTGAITQDYLNQFRDSWLPSLESQFTDQNLMIIEQVYTQVSEMVANSGSIKADAKLTSIIKKAEDRLVVMVQKAQADFEKSSKKKTEEAIDRITVTQGLEEWVEFYEVVEADYGVLIEGSHLIKFRSPLSRQIENKGMYSFQLPFTRELRYSKSRIVGYRMGESSKRFWWFVVVAFVFIAPVLMSMINSKELLGLRNLFYIQESLNPDYKLIALEKLRYLPLIILVSIGYAFNNKNFRILSNLREQYKHRKTVARTLQGIIRSIDETGKDIEIKPRLVEIGAKAMFELKTIGHLSKKDSESSPTNEIFQTFLK